MFTSWTLEHQREQQGREVVTVRFATRAQLGSSFVSQYVSDIAARETARGVRDLQSAGDQQDPFLRTVDSFGFDAALLLDADGRVIDVYPAAPAVVGTPLGGKYAHLTSALAGGVGVSDVVLPAAKHIPVIAVAAPFDTPQGRRVLSGAFSAVATPLGSYFDSSVATPGGRAYFVDAANQVIASGRSPTTDAASPQFEPADLDRLRGSGQATLAGVSYSYVRRPVAGTPWEVILTTPTVSLYASTDSGLWRSRLLVVALAFGALAVFALLGGLARARARVLRVSQESGRQARMLRSVIVNNQSTIYVKDLDGRSMMVNPAFEAFFGVTESELLGQTDDYVDHTSASRQRASDVLARSGLFQIEEVSYRNGVRRLFETSKFPLVDGQGNLYATCGVSLDVTSSRLLAEATESARVAAVEAAVAQRDFTASVSHELRTPTTSIIGYIEEVLEGGNCTSEDVGYLEIASRNAHRLHHIIDDLLVLVEAEVGATMMHVEPSDVGPILESVLATFSAGAQRSGVELSIAVGDDVPHALINPGRLEQSLTNIVGNAIKFTPPGGAVRISVGADVRIDELANSPEHVVAITIADTGVGIAEAEIDQVFDRF